jgi:Cu/Ag efflux pump CusA
MALAGGAVAAFLGNSAFSLSSLFGFLTLLGITVRNGIAMASQFNHLEQQKGQSFGPELVLRGALERLSPILMTTLTTAFALIPVLILGDIPGLEMVRPMAIVILGGLVTTTLFDLFILPALYLRYGASRERDLELQRIPEAELPVAAD